jgi:transcriptional regulator with XRE-family HTH domain
MIRERAGVTQADIAGALGLSREAIAQYESGARTPCSRVLHGYLEILDRLAREELAP